VLTLTSSLTVPTSAVADDTARPIAVLSISSVDHLLEDLGYLTRAAGRADLGMAVLVSTPFIEAFDRTRPAGVLITIDGDGPKGVGFLPVPDADQLLDVFRNKVGAEVDDLGNGIKKLELGKGAFFKQLGPWLFFTDAPRHLASLPADPAAMLDGLDQEYSIALRFYPRHIPQRFKDVADYTVHTQIDADLKSTQLKNPQLDEAFVDSLRKTLKNASSSLINDSDQITIGWAVDAGQRNTYVELKAQAKDGSALARQFASLTDSQSTFTGFLLDDAAAAFQGTLNVTDQGKEQISYFLEYVRTQSKKGIEADPEAPNSLNEIVNNVLDVVDQTVRDGKTDVGATLLLAPKSFQFVGGLRVADGRALAKAFQDFFELAKDQPEVPEVQFYARKHGELDLHNLTLPVAETDEDARQLLGETLNITIATGPESLYFALGKGSDELLERVVDQPLEIGQQSVSPVHLRVALKPLMQFLASIDTANEKQRALVDVIERAQGGDSIELTVRPIENGIGCRIKIAEGVLELMGRASQQNGDR
jgi:hypothetical protein